MINKVISFLNVRSLVMTRFFFSTFKRQFNENPIVFRSMTNKNSKIKIQLNQEIQGLTSNDQFYQFFDRNNLQLNIVNFISYLKRFMEIQIEKKHQQNDQEIDKHIELVARNIERFIKGEQYLNHGDQKSDISRAFSMLLLECVKLDKHQIISKELITSLSKQALRYLEEGNNIDNLNQYEIANMFRSCVQLGYTSVIKKQQFQLLDHVKLKKYKLLTLTSLIHSLTTLTSQDLNAEVYVNLCGEIINKMSLEIVSEYDIYNIYSSLDRMDKLSDASREMISKSLSALIIQQITLPPRTISIILYQHYNHKLTYDKDNLYIQYIEQQLKQVHVKEFDFWMLSHILKFYEHNLHQKLVIGSEELKRIIERRGDSKQFLAMIVASLAKLGLLSNDLLSVALYHFKDGALTYCELSLLFYATSLLSHEFPLTNNYLDYTVESLLQMGSTHPQSKQTLFYILSASQKEIYAKQSHIVNNRIQTLLDGMEISKL